MSEDRRRLLAATQKVDDQLHGIVINEAGRPLVAATEAQMVEAFGDSPIEPGEVIIYGVMQADSISEFLTTHTELTLKDERALIGSAIMRAIYVGIELGREDGRAT